MKLPLPLNPPPPLTQKILRIHGISNHRRATPPRPHSTLKLLAVTLVYPTMSLTLTFPPRLHLTMSPSLTFPPRLQKSLDCEVSIISAAPSFFVQYFAIYFRILPKLNMLLLTHHLRSFIIGHFPIISTHLNEYTCSSDQLFFSVSRSFPSF